MYGELVGERRIGVAHAKPVGYGTADVTAMCRVLAGLYLHG